MKKLIHARKWSHLEKIYGYTVGNKAKGWISKRKFQENKTRQIFRKMNNSYPWYAHVRVRIRE